MRNPSRKQMKKVVVDYIGETATTTHSDKATEN